MKRLLPILLLCTAFCGPAQAEKPAYVTEKDIFYRSEAPDAYAAERCRLDLYRPASGEGFATVVWFHGGGLSGGGKEIPEGLKNKGFAVAAANYRLTPRATVADCIDDAAAAAAWVVRHIARYGGDPKKVFLAGHSAGGYLSSMIGLDKRWLERYGIDPDTTFAAMIPYSGQAVTHFARRRELGIPDTKPLVDDMAPLTYVRPDCVPILILTGDREHEMLGRYEENAYFWRMMRVAGHRDVEIREFDGFDHGQMPQAGHYVVVRYIRDRLKALENEAPNLRNGGL